LFFKHVKLRSFLDTYRKDYGTISVYEGILMRTQSDVYINLMLLIARHLRNYYRTNDIVEKAEIEKI
jgi:hypothetical protein